MKKIIAMIIVLSVLLTMIGALPMTASAAEWHTDWGTENQVLSNGDVVTLIGEGASIYRESPTDVKEKFDISFSIKTNAYGNANVEIFSGTNRASMTLFADKITMTATTSTTFHYNVGYTRHDYRIIAEGGTGSLFIDGVFAEGFSLDSNTNTAKVQFSIQGSGAQNGEMEVSNVEIHPLPVKAKGNNFVDEFQKDGDPKDNNWGSAGEGFWVAKDGIMTGYDDQDEIRFCQKFVSIQPNQDFVTEVKFKVEHFGGNRSIKWYWGSIYSIDMRIYEDYLTFNTRDGSLTSDPISIADGDWHILRIEVYHFGRRATAYMDDVAVADFAIASGNAHGDEIYVFVNGAGGNPSSLSFDYFKYTEKPCQVKVWQPYDGAIYQEGQDIVLSAMRNVDVSESDWGTTYTHKMEFKMNGQTVATGTTSDNINYKATLSNLPVGAYTLTAEYTHTKRPYLGSATTTSYVSSAINFKVVPGIAGELVTETKENGDVLVSLPVTNQGTSQIAKVVYQLDGNGVAESGRYPYSARVKDLAPGSHMLVATCYNQTGIALSKFSAEVSGELSQETSTSGHFANEVSYDIVGSTGIAELNLRNGNHQLWLQHTPNEIFYHTDTGMEKYAINGAGSYTILTDGPVADIYRNGQFLLSYFMPQAEINKRCFYENGLSIQNYQISVPKEKKSYFVKRDVKDQGKVYEIADIPYYYNLDFVAKKRDTINLTVNDGYYHNDITLENGKFYAWVTDQNRSDPYKAELCSPVDTEEDVYYRAEVSAGLCRLYGNGRWLTSYRIMHTSGKDSVKVNVTGGDGLKYLAVSDNQDLHLFYDTFQKKGELSSVDFWQSKSMSIEESNVGALSFNGSALENAIIELNAMPGNVEFSSKVALESCTGGFWLLFNHSISNTYTKVGYNVANGQYEVVEVQEIYHAKEKTTELVEETIAVKKVDSPFNQEVSLNLKTEKTKDGKNMTFWANEEKIFSLDTVSERYGNIGFVVSKARGQINEVSYRGDAKVVYGVQNEPWRDKTSGTDLIEVGNKLVMASDGKRAVSTDGGKTWKEEDRKDGDSSSVETLSSGKILSVRREVVQQAVTEKDESGKDVIVEPALYQHISYISEDNGETWTRQGPVQTEPALEYRLTMPNRVTQGASGRIYFASCENNDETAGDTVIYYSDNEGWTWTASETRMDAKEIGFCVQEVVCLDMKVEGTDDYEARAYFRNDLGYIHYFISKDKGVTWDLNTPYKTPFYSALNCFNVQRDPYDTTGKTLFAAWGYDNPNLAAVPQYPRTRWAVARSTDGGETWEYIGTVHENSDTGFAMMNLSINVGKDYIVLSAMSRDMIIDGSTDGKWYQRKVTLPKNQKGSKRFDQVHMQKHSSIMAAQMLPDAKVERILLVHPASGSAMVQGSRIENASYDGYLALDCAAAFVGATVSAGSNGAMVLTCGSSPITISASDLTEKDGKKYVKINTFASTYQLNVIEMDGVQIISPYDVFSENQKKGIAASINL